MKSWIKWLVLVVVLALLGAGVMRALNQRRAQQQALAQSQQPRQQALVELADSDVVVVHPRALHQGLAISGTIRAVNSAFVKAKVAGELKGLSLREGDPVRAGQVVATVDTTEYQARLNQALRQANAAKAQIDIAQRQYDNNKALVEQGFISRTALETSLATLDGAKATYEAANAGAEVARKALDDAVLRAPISGMISQRLTQPGERVAVDGRIIEITDLGQLELEATVSATDSMAVRIGQSASVQVEGSRDQITARVVRINPSAQAGSRSVLVYLGIDKPQGLRQGLFAQGTLGTGQMQSLAVPLSTVRTDKPSPYVQVVEGQKIRHKAVVFGPQGTAPGDSSGQTWVAVQGLQDGDKVLSGAVGTLREGSDVRFTSSKP